MSTTIDDKVVQMKFDNSAFQRGVQSTIDAVGRLTKALQLDHVGRGISKVFDGVRKNVKLDDAAKNVETSTGRIAAGINNAAGAGKRFSLAPMINSVSAVSREFSVMQIAGVTAIASIAHQALVSAQQFVKGFTVAPINQGLQEYETNLNAIQTILANTGLEGQKGLDKVNGALQELNEYSDKTIYNFSQMAKNIGTFTSAGVDLETSTSAIKGIANLAAVSGSNADQASTAMYQLSQALASGSVKLMDWNSVVNAGMGGKVFQESLKETARAHGVAIDTIIKEEGSFRDSLQTGWLSSDILTETLSKFTGDLSAEQLKQMGYTEKQIEGIMKMGKVATDAATKVKTFSQLVGTLKEAAASGWAKTWMLLLGDFGQAKTMFTNINNVLGGMIQKSADVRNKLLGEWNKMGGRDLLIGALGRAFKSLIAVLKPIQDAFRQIFPKKTAKELYDLTVRFSEFTKKLMIGKDTAALLKRTFAGVFALFSIAGQVIKGITKFIGGFFIEVANGSGAFLGITAGIGDWLVNLDKMLKKNGDITKFFTDLKKLIEGPLTVIRNVAKAVSELFLSFASGDATKTLGVFDQLQKALKPLKTAAERVGAVFKFIGNLIGRVAGKIAGGIKDIGYAIGEQLAKADFNKVLDVINTSLLGGIVLMLKRFLSGGVNVDVGGGLFDKIKGSLDAVTETLGVMQANIKSNIILKIAGALALLTASILILSTIPSDKITTSLAALAVGLAGIVGVMTLLDKQIDVKATLKLPIISAAMIGIASALVILAGAIKIMSTIPIEDMYRSIAGLSLALGLVAAIMKKMPTNMVLQAVALNGIATALVVLAGAVLLFSTFSWDELVHGLAGIGGALITLAIGMRLMPKDMVLQAAALGILALALNGLAIAMKVFATMEWEELLKGLAGIGGVLLIIAAAMRVMPKNLIKKATGILILSGALNILAVAIMAMGTMGWEQIAKGLVTLGGALAIIAIALNLMGGTILGATALVIAAGALALLTPVLITLGLLPWTVIVQGLLALAGIFVVLGVAGLLLAPLTPVIIGLSAAVVLIGLGLALAGAGAFLFAAAFTAVVVAGAAGISVLTDILDTFIAAIPATIEAFGVGLVKLAEAIATGGPAITGAFTTVLTSILQAIINTIPKLAELFTKMITTALQVVTTLSPKIVAAGWQLILDFLKGVRDNIGEMVNVVTDIVIEFLDALGDRIDDIIQAGVDFILDFLDGIAKAIENNTDDILAAGVKIGVAIIKGMGNAIKNGAKGLIGGIKNVGKSMIGGIGNALGINSPSKEFYKIGAFVMEGLAKGLTDTQGLPDRAVKRVATNTLETMRAAISGLSTSSVDLQPVISPVLDLSDVRKNAKQLSGMLPAPGLKVEASLSSARSASASYDENQQAAVTETPVAAPSSEITFVQTNSSPKALTEAEIYRQTKNLLSTARGALSRA